MKRRSRSPGCCPMTSRTGRPCCGSAAIEAAFLHAHLTGREACRHRFGARYNRRAASPSFRPMINKQVPDIAAALEGIRDGATILSAGFGAVGAPDELLDGLLTKGVRDLVVVSN